MIDATGLVVARQGRHRRHRMDAGRDRAGAADDPGARPLLRRSGAVEEHPEHVHDVHRRDRGRGRHLGRGRLFVRLRRGQRDHRRLRARLPQRRHLRAARGRHDPAPALLRLPGDLLHHHHRARLGGGGGADALRAVPRLRGALVVAGLLGARALGVRPRLAVQRRHPRLRRRDPGRDGLRVLGAGGGAGGRGPKRLRAIGAASPQRRLRPARRRPAVVRLVRLQRRQRIQHRIQLDARVRRTRC